MKMCQLGALFIDLHDVYARIFIQLAHNGHVICLFWTALQNEYSSSTQTFHHTTGESAHRWIGNKQQTKVEHFKKRARQAELVQSIKNMILKWVVSETGDDKWMEMLCTQLRLITGWGRIVQLEILERNFSWLARAALSKQKRDQASSPPLLRYVGTPKQDRGEESILSSYSTHRLGVTAYSNNIPSQTLAEWQWWYTAHTSGAHVIL